MSFKSKVKSFETKSKNSEIIEKMIIKSKMNKSIQTNFKNKFHSVELDCFNLDVLFKQKNIHSFILAKEVISKSKKISITNTNKQVKMENTHKNVYTVCDLNSKIKTNSFNKIEPLNYHKDNQARMLLLICFALLFSTYYYISNFNKNFGNNFNENISNSDKIEFQREPNFLNKINSMLMKNKRFKYVLILMMSMFCINYGRYLSKF